MTKFIIFGFNRSQIPHIIKFDSDQGTKVFYNTKEEALNRAKAMINCDARCYQLPISPVKPYISQQLMGYECRDQNETI